MSTPEDDATQQPAVEADAATPSDQDSSRRNFLSTAAMSAGLVVTGGSICAMAGRFLYPVKSENPNWQYVATTRSLPLGLSFEYTTPAGAKVVVARQEEGEDESAFIALSSVCPHLGCQVHWESNRNEFFCPCHNGAFDTSGKATEGPPAMAGQSLTRFPLKVANGLLYIEVPGESVSSSETGEV